MAKYVITSNVPSYNKAWGLDVGNKFVEADSESEARRLAVSISGIPAAAIQAQQINVPASSIAGGLQPLTSTKTASNVSAGLGLTGPATTEGGDWSNVGGSGAAYGTDLSNIEGFYRSPTAPNNNAGSFANFVNEMQGYDPSVINYSGQPRTTVRPPVNNFDPSTLQYSTGDTFNPSTLLYSGESFDPSTLDYRTGEQGVLPPVAAPPVNNFDPSALDYWTGEEGVALPVNRTLPLYDPEGMSGQTLGVAPPEIDAAEQDSLEAERIARQLREQDQERQKRLALLNGPVRSWDAKLADITLSYDTKGRVTVNLPVDMWRNADSTTPSNQNQTIGKEQIEDAIRRLAELGGKDTLNSAVKQMLQQARNYYSTTPRSSTTWDKNIEGGLIPEDQRSSKDFTAGGTWRGSFLNDSAWEATWGGLADEVIDPKKKSIESQIPSGWANNVTGWNQLSESQQNDAKANNLNSMKEVEDYYADKALQYDPSGGGETGLEDFGGTPPPPPADPAGGPPFDSADAVYDYYFGDSFDPSEPAGDPNQFDFAQGAMEGFQSDGTGGAGGVGAGATGGLMTGAGTGLGITGAGTPGVPAFSSQDLINDPQGFLTAAGQRLAFRNVFGEPATAVGPLASYLQRQTFPLTDAYRAGSFANMAREQAGEVAPQTTFEDFLRTVRDQPTGLGGAYGQALQNVNYLRGLGSGQTPTALAGVFNPEQAAATRDARALLDAAQRGKYSGLVSRSFRRPTEEDLFSDYVLARQDAATAGTAPQNFLNFAASRYGL